MDDPVDDAVAAMVEARRPGWTVEEFVERRVETYLLARRVDAMAAMPLWYEDSGPGGVTSTRPSTGHTQAVPLKRSKNPVFGEKLSFFGEN